MLTLSTSLRAILRMFDIKCILVDKLPDEMLKKAEDAVLAWQKEGFDQVKKQLEHWQHARAELDKRLKVNEEFERLKTSVEKQEA